MTLTFDTHSTSLTHLVENSRGKGERGRAGEVGGLE